MDYPLTHASIFSTNVDDPIKQGEGDGLPLRRGSMNTRKQFINEWAKVDKTPPKRVEALVKKLESVGVKFPYQK